MDGGWRAPEQVRPKLGKIEGQDAAQIDVLVPNRRDTAQHLVGILTRNPVDGDLEPVRVPGHDDVGEQGPGSGDRAELFHRAARALR